MNEQELPTKILIGLEIHITLDSQKKIFNCENTYKGNILPNSQVGPWELGYLGVLPIINSEVIYLGLKLASSLAMEISPVVLFDRKIYNYFDLPKGYQITQQQVPFAISGYLPIINENGLRKIPIKLLQLEEDTAKSTYSKEQIKLDFNRAGNPLIELVTEPVFQKVETVLLFINQLQSLLRYLEISQAKMEQGQLRIDLNFSLQLGNNYVTPRYEVKNLNSLANIEKALQYELHKHQLLVSQEKIPPLSQTLGFDETKQITITHREKTSYFYLPEVNIPPINLTSKEIEKIRKNLPKLPWKYWEEIKKLDDFTANNLLKNPNLLKIFNFLEKQQKFAMEESKNWMIFYLNYLSPYLENNGLNFFEQKWQSYYSLFQAWKEKKLENEEIKEVISLLIATKNTFASLIKKYQKEIFFDQKLIENLLVGLWNDELAKMFAVNRQKTQNYLLGQVKKNYPQYSLKEIIAVVEKFLEKK